MSKAKPFDWSVKLKIMYVAARDRRLQRTDVAVISAVLDHANNVTGICYCAVSTIVDESGVPKSTVLRALGRVESAGYWTSTKRHGVSTVYAMTGPAHGTSPKPGTGATWSVSGSAKNLLTGATAMGKTGPAGGALIGSDNEKKEEQGAIRESFQLMTFDEFIKEHFSRTVEKAQEGLFKYADSVDMPRDYVLLAFSVWRRKFESSDKRRADWWEHLNRHIREDWLKLWAIDSSGNYYLTTPGKQAAREYDFGDLDQEDRQRANRPRTARRLGSDQ